MYHCSACINLLQKVVRGSSVRLRHLTQQQMQQPHEPVLLLLLPHVLVNMSATEQVCGRYGHPRWRVQ